MFWGLTPIFWNLVAADAASLLLHRIVWAVPILFLIVTERRQWAVLARGYAGWRPRLTTIAASVLLAINWGVFVWAVTNGHIVEASLGYFINPLVSVALGVVVLRERLRRLQWIAVGIAAVGVTTMGILAGVPPWISLILAFSFGVYGLLKKRDVTPPPVVSLFGETLVMFVPALFILVVIAVLLYLMYVVVRFVQRVVLKLVLFALLAGFGVSLWVQRADLEECARTCECRLYGQTVEVPWEQLPEDLRVRLADGDVGCREALEVEA